MKIKLPANSCLLLRNILSAVGWANTIDDAYRGGKMLSENIVPDPPADESGKEMYDLDLSGHEVTVCKKAIERMLAKEQVPISKWLFILIEGLELEPKDQGVKQKQ